MKTKLRNAISHIKVKLITLSILAYLVSLVWFLLYPAISISSGETKPRGLFVDENALLVNSALPKRLSYSSNLTYSGISFCDASDRLSLSHQCAVVSLNFDGITYNVSQSIVDTRYNPLSLESIVVGVVYNMNQTARVHPLVNYLIEILQDTKWLAKRVVILQIPLNENEKDKYIVDKIFKSWTQTQLLMTHSSDINDDSKSNPNSNSNADLGLIRDAYILDLTLLHLDVDVIGKDNSKPLSFQSLQVLHSGVNGILPNMDIVSYPLNILQRDSVSGWKGINMHSESYTMILSNIYSQLKLNTIKQSVTRGTTSSSLSHTLSHTVSIQVIWLIDTYLSQLFTTSYCHKLSGLVSSVYGSVTSRLSMHSSFLEVNIDAITLRGLPIVSSSNANMNSKSNSKRSDYNEEVLLNAIYKLIYTSNNLHEELHHSMFHYLLMGTAHFVGITEYGLTSLLMLVSIFILYVHFAPQCHIQNITTTVLTVLGCVLSLYITVCILREKSLGVYVHTIVSNMSNSTISCGDSLKGYNVTYDNNTVIAVLMSVYCCCVICVCSSTVFAPSIGSSKQQQYIERGAEDLPVEVTTTMTDDSLPVENSENVTLNPSTTSELEVTTDDVINSVVNTANTTNMHAEYMTASLLLLLCLFAWLFAQYFSLAFIAYVTTMSSVIVICCIANTKTKAHISITRTTTSITSSSKSSMPVSILYVVVLLVIVCMHSPYGVYIGMQMIDALVQCDNVRCSSLVATITDWTETGSYTFPAQIIIHSVVSFMAVNTIAVVYCMRLK